MKREGVEEAGVNGLRSGCGPAELAQICYEHHKSGTNDLNLTQGGAGPTLALDSKQKFTSRVARGERGVHQHTQNKDQPSCTASTKYSRFYRTGPR